MGITVSVMTLGAALTSFASAHWMGQTLKGPFIASFLLFIFSLIGFHTLVMRTPGGHRG